MSAVPSEQLRTVLWMFVILLTANFKFRKRSRCSKGPMRGWQTLWGFPSPEIIWKDTEYCSERDCSSNTNLKMMGVISRTDFIQRQFTFTSETKKDLAYIKLTTHRLRKLFLFPRHQERECLWFLNLPKKGKKYVYKRFANPGRKGEGLLL